MTPSAVQAAPQIDGAGERRCTDVCVALPFPRCAVADAQTGAGALQLSKTEFPSAFATAPLCETPASDSTAGRGRDCSRYHPTYRRRGGWRSTRAWATETAGWFSRGRTTRRRTRVRAQRHGRTTRGRTQHTAPQHDFSCVAVHGPCAFREAWSYAFHTPSRHVFGTEGARGARRVVYPDGARRRRCSGWSFSGARCRHGVLVGAPVPNWRPRTCESHRTARGAQGYLRTVDTRTLWAQ